MTGLHDHGMQTHAQGFISRDKAGDASPHDQDLAAVGTVGNLRQRRPVAGSLIEEPGVVKRKIGDKRGDIIGQ